MKEAAISKNTSKISTCKSVKFQKRDFWFSLFLGSEIGILFYLIVRFIKPDFVIALKGFIIPPLGMSVALFIFSFAAILTAFKLGEKFRILCQIGKFGFIGVGNTLVDIFALNLLMYLLFIPETSILKGFFYAASFLVAMIHSFSLNKFWTFEQKHTKRTAQEFSLFIFISFLGLLIHTGIATTIANILVRTLNETISLNVGKLFGVMFSLVWNFTGYKLFVFKKVKK